MTAFFVQNLFSNDHGNELTSGQSSYFTDAINHRNQFFRNSNIDFQIIHFTRPEGGRRISYTSTTYNAVKLFI